MLIKEYRVVLPFSVEEYQVGQLYAVARASKNETGGGEGVQVLKNEPYEENGEKGQFTHKKYYLESKVPALIRALAPNGALVVDEKAWNAYPYCKTVITNEYMKPPDFEIKIETWHKNDMGDQDNVHGLDKATLEKVSVVDIDITNASVISAKDRKPESDPCQFKSKKRNQGPLGPGWKEKLAKDTSASHMCAYKLVTVNFKWLGLQSKVEKTIHKVEERVFTQFHRELFCWMDEWIDMTMDDIRKMEDDTKAELEEMRSKDGVKGMSDDD